MIETEMQTPYMKEQLKIYQTTVSEYLQLDDKTKTFFYEFCNLAFQKKYSYNEFIKKSDEYTLSDNIKWYILGNFCVDKVLQTDCQFIEFFEWFNRYSHLNAYLFYSKILTEKFQNKTLLKKYTDKLDGIIDYANQTFLNYIREDEKPAFKEFLKKNAENSDILNILNDRTRMHYRYISNGVLYFALTPILNLDIKKVVKILSKINCIFLLEDFLTINTIEYDIELICKILSLAPKITNNSEKWNNKAILLPLLTIILNNNLLHVYELYKNTTHEVDDILKKHIELFIKQLKQRPDCNFFIQKWLLHLVSILDSRSETYKKITQMTIQIIGLEIVEQDESFSKNFFENEHLSNKRKELLLALIYTTDSMNFPLEYLKLFRDYILDLSNKIYISSDKSFIKTEHYLLSQLFIEIDKPADEWQKIWNALYIERQKAMHSNYEDNMHNISHSQYLILTGIAVIEYFISKKQVNSATTFFENIWKALMELYLTMRYFLHEDFLHNMIVRYIILENLIGIDSQAEINMVKDNPELISNIILNLKNNNFDITFISKNDSILHSLNTCITQWKISDKKHIKFKENYYLELENIYNKYCLKKF